jgi:hypothetical protein
MSLSLHSKVLSLVLLAFFVLAGASTSRADDEKVVHFQFDRTDWKDVLAFYQLLTGREPNFAPDFPQQLNAAIALPETQLPKSKTIDLLEKAFQEQCGVLLWPDPNSKSVTITYTAKPKQKPAANGPAKKRIDGAEKVLREWQEMNTGKSAKDPAPPKK